MSFHQKLSEVEQKRRNHEAVASINNASLRTTNADEVCTSVMEDPVLSTQSPPIVAILDTGTSIPPSKLASEEERMSVKKRGPSIPNLYSAMRAHCNDISVMAQPEEFPEEEHISVSQAGVATSGKRNNNNNNDDSFRLLNLIASPGTTPTTSPYSSKSSFRTAAANASSSTSFCTTALAVAEAAALSQGKKLAYALPDAAMADNNNNSSSTISSKQEKTMSPHRASAAPKTTTKRYTNIRHGLEEFPDESFTPAVSSLSSSSSSSPFAASKVARLKEVVLKDYDQHDNNVDNTNDRKDNLKQSGTNSTIKGKDRKHSATKRGHTAVSTKTPFPNSTFQLSRDRRGQPDLDVEPHVGKYHSYHDQEDGLKELPAQLLPQQQQDDEEQNNDHHPACFVVAPGAIAIRGDGQCEVPRSRFKDGVVSDEEYSRSHCFGASDDEESNFGGERNVEEESIMEEENGDEEDFPIPHSQLQCTMMQHQHSILTSPCEPIIPTPKRDVAFDVKKCSKRKDMHTGCFVLLVLILVSVLVGINSSQGKSRHQGVATPTIPPVPTASPAPTITFQPTVTMAPSQNPLEIACQFIGMLQLTSSCQSTTSVSIVVVDDGTGTIGSSATIPSEIGLLTQLTHLDLSDNRLMGTIPSTLGALTRLTALLLQNNALSGSIPFALGLNLNQLTYLDISRNELTGSIPWSIGQLTNLVHLDLTRNLALTGPIGPSISKLRQLTSLQLHDNSLTGTVPTAMGDLSQLVELRLSQNTLTGTIPPSLGGLTQLTVLTFASNKLTGTIPQDLENLTQLQELSFVLNDLSGTIPPSLCQRNSSNNSSSVRVFINCEELQCICCVSNFGTACST